MINNSSLEKWNRLEAKSLDNQFINDIINGLNCSNFEADDVKRKKQRRRCWIIN